MAPDGARCPLRRRQRPQGLRCNPKAGGCLPPDPGNGAGGERRATDEEKEAYGQFAANIIKTLYQEKTADAIAETMRAPGGASPIEGLAQIVSSVVARVAASGIENGLNIGHEMTMAATMQAAEDVGTNMAEAAGAPALDEEQMQAVFLRSMELLADHGAARERTGAAGAAAMRGRPADRGLPTQGGLPVPQGGPPGPQGPPPPPGGGPMQCEPASRHGASDARRTPGATGTAPAAARRTDAVTGLHLTLTGIGSVLSVVGAAGGIYRFYILPWMRARRAEEERTMQFRREAKVWFQLIEETMPAEVAERRKTLIGELGV